ncbi:MAG: hypothetical protein RIQ93_3165, partial [Verrucomicrobiota bacterium]
MLAGMRLLRAKLILLVTLTLSLVAAKAIENTWNYSVQVSSTVESSPARITLNWPQETDGVPFSYTVYRKAPNDASWGAGTALAGSVTTYVDTNVTAGVAYEYRLVKATNNYTGYGYIQTGIEAPLVENRGKVVLIVDDTFSVSLAAELARLQQDLVGDGWSVVRHEVSRTDSVATVKGLIKADYEADPTQVKSVFLFGHIAVPYSGQLNPDGHGDHTGAWPADVYYGDMDGIWTDDTVNYTQSSNTDMDDANRLTNRPGDGKFDQTEIPSFVELQVGRVDLANMPGRVTWGGPATFASETELMRKYLNKDHHFRHRITNAPRRAIVGDYFGIRGGEAFSASGYRGFAPLVGANNVRNLNVEFNDQQGVWIPQLKQNDYLLAYACGAGSYASISGIGSGLYNGGDTVEMVNSNVRGVFNLLFGSWLGDWDHEDNILRAPLLTDYGLVSVWSGRPHWFIHPIGLGETFGYATQLTQNNTNQYQTHINSSAHRIHIALMGDPTLRLHPVVPARALTGSVNGSTVSLSWNASTDSALLGYHVYRASSALGSYARLTSAPTTETNYSDESAPAGAVYMVRAIKLENTTSGSYHNPSQGIFWSQAEGPSGGGGPAIAAMDTAGAVTSSPAPAPTASVTPFETSDSSETTPVVSAAWFDDELTTLAIVPALSTDLLSEIAGPDGATWSEPVPSASAAKPVSPLRSGDVVWFDDSLPRGASGSGIGGDSWRWVSTAPVPFSGKVAHQTNLQSGLHEHSFNWANDTMAVTSGQSLFVHVYLDPLNKPAELLVSWSVNGDREHRAYWGADNINYGQKNTAGRYYAGPLPAAGQWVRLQIPASAVGLEGATINGMGFSLYDGRATWDVTGKTTATTGSTSPIATTDSSSTTTTSPTPTTTTTVTDVVWIDDALPAGSSSGSTGGDAWNWVSSNPTPISGA